MLPCPDIIEPLAEVNGWIGFAERFVHLRTRGSRGPDRINDRSAG
jgi:hypothetical protein